jgi:hypothetical protein
MTFTTSNHDGRQWVDVNELIEHLTTAMETVRYLCGQSSPHETAIVVDTLEVTRDTLDDIRLDIEPSADTCFTCGHPASVHVHSADNIIDRCNFPAGADSRCTCMTFEVRP